MTVSGPETKSRKTQRLTLDPGEYFAKTAHLTMCEEGALGRIVGFMLTTRHPLTRSRAVIVARPMNQVEREATDYVLNHFFTVEDGELACRLLSPVHRKKWSKRNYDAALERDGVCRYCGGDDDLTIDHIVPRCQGGGDELRNLAVACRPCNSRKGGRTPEQAGMVLQ